MPDKVRTRQNRGKAKLLACVPCEKCRATIYPGSTTSYRVREASGGFLQAPAFYYSHHVPSCEQEAT